MAHESSGLVYPWNRLAALDVLGLVRFGPTLPEPEHTARHPRTGGPDAGHPRPHHLGRGRAIAPAVEKAIGNPEIRARLEKLYFIVDFKSPNEMKRLISEEYEIVSGIAKRIGLAK
jgi:hypothetical protein